METLRSNSKNRNKLYVYLKYAGHIAFLAGKPREAFPVDKGDKISDLLLKLDKYYPGIKEIFMPSGGIFNSKTGIFIRRINQPTFSVMDKNEKIVEGDIITLW